MGTSLTHRSTTQFYLLFSLSTETTFLLLPVRHRNNKFKRPFTMLSKALFVLLAATSAQAFAPMMGRPSATSTKLGYAVKLISEEHDIDATIECADDVFIVDAAEEQGIDLPYSCRAGSCSTCTGKIISGEVDQSEQNFLDEDQMGDGYVLTCVAYPKGDCTIQVHMEDDLF